jgi:hypothetical protein
MSGRRYQLPLVLSAKKDQSDVEGANRIGMLLGRIFANGASTNCYYSGMVQAEGTRKRRARKASGKQSNPVKHAPAARAGMSAEHKRALAQGRAEGRAVRRYLNALQTVKPKRGRKRTAESIERQLDGLEGKLLTARPLPRLLLIQKQLELQAELENPSEPIDLVALEDAFVMAAAGYSQRKGISYTAWRAEGVSVDVLRRAGIPRTRFRNR